MGVQYQARAADLRIKNIGRIRWISAILEKVADVTRETRKKRKLIACIQDWFVVYKSKTSDNEMHMTADLTGLYLVALRD